MFDYSNDPFNKYLEDLCTECVKNQYLLDINNNSSIFDITKLLEINRFLDYAQIFSKKINTYNLRILIHSIVLMKRYCLNKNIYLCTKNIHKLFLVSTIVTLKLYDDNSFSNKYYIKLGGFNSLNEFNKMEEDFLIGLNWETIVDIKDNHSISSLV